MKKMLFLTVAALLFAGQSAAEDGRYIRKQPTIKTDFFVPSQAINTEPEKLPPFYNEQAPQTDVQQAEIIAVSTPNDDTEIHPASTGDMPLQKHSKELPNYLNETAVQSQKQGPEYKQEYAAYQRDLATIAQTGKPSPNPALEKDLAKMNSEERLRVSSDGSVSGAPADRINPMAYATSPDSNIKILEAVEITRENPFEVPESEDSITVSDQGESRAIEPILESEVSETRSMSPETAAHFQGMNPFRNDTAPTETQITEEQEVLPPPTEEEPEADEEKIESQHPAPAPYISKIKLRHRRPTSNAVR